MAGTREIRSQIRSVKSTQKITSAMEMVAASKMRRAQQRMQSARPYAAAIGRIMGHIARGARVETAHPYLETRPLARTGLIVVGTDRGLCGGLNINLFRAVLGRIAGWDRAQVPVSVVACGAKAEGFFKRCGARVVASCTHLGEPIAMAPLLGAIGVVLAAYRVGELDAVHLAYNRCVSAMSQVPEIVQLLPLSPQAIPEPHAITEPHVGWDYLYEPDPESLLDVLLQRYLEMQVYHAVVENSASEQAARMFAMRSASDNASALVDDLQRAYNKARQAAITQELAEIVSGAQAV